MSNAVCPSCGVAVVPGYVRCPKCHKPLPRRKSTVVEGGTAVESSGRVPLVAVIAAGVISIGAITYFGVRGGGSKAKAAPVAAPTPAPEPATPTQTAPSPVETETTPQAPSAPDPNAIAGSLERALKKERLWSTVSVTGGRVDVRSGSCSDPKMQPLLDGAAPSFKAAGLTKLRCLEQSGAVVTDRDL